MTFCEYYADYQEDTKSQQLKKLKTGDVIYKFYPFQFTDYQEDP
jgi:hypothetical protein